MEIGIEKCAMLIMKSGKRQIRKESERLEKSKYLRVLQQQAGPRNKRMGCPSCEIIGTILKMDKGRTQTNELEDKKVDNTRTRRLQ